MFNFFLSCLKIKIVFHQQPLQKLTSSCPCFRQKQPKINPNLPLRAEQNFISATQEWGAQYCPLPATILSFDLIYDFWALLGGRKLECCDSRRVPELVTAITSTVIITLPLWEGWLWDRGLHPMHVLPHDSPVRQTWDHHPLTRWGNWGSLGPKEFP